MTKQLEKFEQDRAWLLIKKPHATESDLDMFVEKVAVFTENYDMNEDRAREEAYFMMCGIHF